MKKYIAFIPVLFLLLSCTDLDDVERRLNQLEQSKAPSLISMSVRAEDNPSQLVEDAVCTIIGDSIVDCWAKNLTTEREFIVRFKYVGEKLLVNGNAVTGDGVRLDFTNPVQIRVVKDGKHKDYNAYFRVYTGLPVLWIETENREEITSKETYLKARLRLIESVSNSSGEYSFEDSVRIKGRGNTTWNLEKKPYRLKFDEKVALLGRPKDKSWVLLANYTDKTSLRNHVAFYMGSISNLDYTPQFSFVDLILNGQYNGTYQLGDKLKIGKNRVNVGDDGFLLEIDFRAPREADARYFTTPHLVNPVNIKDPDTEYGDDNFNYIKNFILTAEQALFSDDFTDPDEGWQKYMDMDSFVDWYLINEIARNNDACLWASCYMNVKRGGKLKMGPLWDFDIAFGNVNENVNHDCYGFHIRYSTWFMRLFEDPVFVSRVKARFNYFYANKESIMSEINRSAQYIRYSVQENENRWHTLYRYTWPNYDVWGSYLNEVQSMKEWLNKRFEWLKEEFDKMG